jgi:hypothetical protein
MRALASALLLSGPGCSASGTEDGRLFTDTDAGVEAGDATFDGAASDAPLLASDAPSFSGDARACTGAASIAITSFASNAACYYDTSLREGSTGTLLYECNGGASKLTIGPEVFLGTYDPKTGTISLREQRNFPFSDGCTWTSVQTITGDLEKGAFQYGYAEYAASGSACDTPCVASAQMTADVTPIPPPR